MKTKKILRIGASLFLVLHGLIHWMGFFVYLQLAEIEGLPYKTNLLNGLWELGEQGMAVFGFLWAPAGLLFLAVGLTWLIRRTLPGQLLLGAAVYSLVLTGLDYSTSYAGMMINLLILVLVAVTRLAARKKGLAP